MAMAAPHFVALDYVVLMSFLALSAGIGVFIAWRDRRTMSNKHFLTGNRQLNRLPVSLSMMASYLSSIGILGQPSEVFLRGSTLWTSAISATVSITVAAFVFLPMYYKMDITSINEVRVGLLCDVVLLSAKEDGSPWEPTKNSRICSQHFINGEKSNDPRSPAYVPTIFPSVYGRTKHGTSKRYQRLRARKQKVDSITDAQALEDVMVDCTSEEEKISAAVKETVASSKRLARVAMACMSAEMSVVPTGEGLRLASGDDTDVASVVVPEVKSMGACTASLGGEVACEAKSVESPTGASMTAADSALAAVSVVARSDAVVTVAEAAGRWR
ncbi:hypothetical protein MTO96_031399, partial [Rhipicephalus appendiculatus]